MSQTKTSERPISILDLYERHQVGIGTPTDGAQVSSRRTDPGDAVMPPRPHLNPSTFERPEATTEPQPADSSDELPSADTLRSSVDVARDAIHNLAALERIAVAGTPSGLFHGFQAQWEVDRFAWPNVCTTLVDSCHQSLSDILRRLTLLSNRGQKAFAITAYSPGEGCSTLAMCLARMAAAEGQQVALLDGNLDSPTISRDLGISFDSGWQDNSSQLPVSETAVYSIDDQLNVLPISAKVEEIDDQTRDRGVEIIGSLADACDLVLIDSGPMFVAARQWFCATVHDCIDGALVVRDMRRTVADQVDDVCFRIGQCGIHELAVIENFQP